MAYICWRRVFLASTLMTSCAPLPTMTPLAMPPTTEDIPASAEDAKTTERMPTTTLDYDLMDFDEFIASTGSLSDFGPSYINTATPVDSNVAASNASVNANTIISDTTGNDPDYDYDYDTSNNSTSNSATSADTSLGANDRNTNNEQTHTNGYISNVGLAGSVTEATDITENNNDLSGNNDIDVASNQSTDLQNADGTTPASGEENEEEIVSETTTIAAEHDNTDVSKNDVNTQINERNVTTEAKSNVADHNTHSKSSAISGAEGNEKQTRKEETKRNNDMSTEYSAASRDSHVYNGNSEKQSRESIQQSHDTGDSSDDSIPETEQEDMSDSLSNIEEESPNYDDTSGTSTQTSENTHTTVWDTHFSDEELMKHSTSSAEISNEHGRHSAESGYTSTDSHKGFETDNELSVKSDTATHTDSVQSMESDTLARVSSASSGGQQHSHGESSSVEDSTSMDHCFGHRGSHSKFCELARTVRMICTTIFPDYCFRSVSTSHSFSSEERSNEISPDSSGIEILSNSMDNIVSSESTVSDIREVILIIKGLCPSICSGSDRKSGSDDHALSDDDDDDSDGVDSESTDDNDNDDSHEEMEDLSSRESEGSNTDDKARAGDDIEVRTHDESEQVYSHGAMSHGRTGTTSADELVRKQEPTATEMQSVGKVHGTVPENNEHDESDRSGEMDNEARTSLKTTPDSELATEQNGAIQHTHVAKFSSESLSENDNESE